MEVLYFLPEETLYWASSLCNVGPVLTWKNLSVSAHAEAGWIAVRLSKEKGYPLTIPLLQGSVLD
jgi:hypothetical protein